MDESEIDDLIREALDVDKQRRARLEDAKRAEALAAAAGMAREDALVIVDEMGGWPSSTPRERASRFAETLAKVRKTEPPKALLIGHRPERDLVDEGSEQA
jgi:hypothetical protein